MRKLLLALMAIAITLFTSFVAKAEGILYLGYCDGAIASSSEGTITGLTGSSATISQLICIPGSKLAGYAGLQITGINAGLASASSNPTALTGFIRESQSGENIASGSLESPATGWNVISLSTPYTITGNETELWFGFEFKQSKKLNVISFAGETSADGCWIGKNGKYTDYSGKNYGSLAVEAILEGEGIPTHDLTILSASTIYPCTKIGDPLIIDVRIRNNASTAADQPVLDYTIDGVTNSYVYPAVINYRQDKKIRLEIPSDSYPEGMLGVDFNLRWADGSEDYNPADNTAHVDASMVKEAYKRYVVGEEATGSWCGWCVRGIVGMKYMRENYERWIGIGVHDGDEYAVKAYDNWMGSQISGYPSALVNRDGTVYDPNSEELEEAYLALPPYTDLGIELTASMLNESTINFHTETRVLNDMSVDYNLVYVVVEDKCPISQHNYYSGGGYGSMGGFENESNPVSIELDDIARAVYPTPKGQSGIIPASMVNGETYTYDYEAALPTILNVDNVWAAVLVIDNATGAIVQAAKVPYIKGLSGIDQIKADQNAAPAVMYNLNGQRVNEAKGLVISNGRVSFIR